MAQHKCMTEGCNEFISSKTALCISCTGKLETLQEARNKGTTESDIESGEIVCNETTMIGVFGSEVSESPDALFYRQEDADAFIEGRKADPDWGWSDAACLPCRIHSAFHNFCGETPDNFDDRAEVALRDDYGVGFGELAHGNAARTDVFDGIDKWSASEWASDMAGECGEACNLIKKLRRGDDINPLEIGRELADVVIYADILSQKLGLNLGEMVKMKFNEVSARLGSKVFI